MKQTQIASMLIAAMATTPAFAAPTLGVVHRADNPGSPASAEHFTGTVRTDTRFKAHPPANTSGAIVYFEPGARTDWHTHPIGQTLLITKGHGWVQQDGQPRRTVNAGDVVYIPANTRHWHGATANSAMTHVAIVEAAEDGTRVGWQEKVDDATYLNRHSEQ